MKIFDNLAVWQDFRKTLQGEAPGFVPTMGNLHQGHLSLIQKSQTENATTVVSLFVNPKQFNNPEDYIQYPVTLEEDFAKLREARVDYCLLPAVADVYADGYRYQISENSAALTLEGKQRPGHFTGVLTVVMKLLNLVSPKSVYLGEKDYQQYVLLRDMVKAFFMPVQVILCPTVREQSGLACSSRNNRLNSSQKEVAARFARIFLQKKPEAALVAALEAEGIEVEYLAQREGRRFIAIRLGDIRLIDNYSLVD